jgi:transcription antitermination factor NusG
MSISTNANPEQTRDGVASLTLRGESPPQPPAADQQPFDERAWILDSPGRWWVLHTRARNEKRVAAALDEAQVRYYLPLVNVQRTYTKSRFTFRIPLFPGYVFLCGDHEQCAQARRTNRIANVIYVEDQDRLRAELQHVDSVLESGQTVELYPALQIGQRCRVAAGALKGVEGVVIRRGGRCRMYLAVSTLGQSVVVEVDGALLESAG